MKTQLRLRRWVKVVVTLIVMSVVMFGYNKVTGGQVNIKYCELYWFCLVPVSFIGLEVVWEA